MKLDDLPIEEIEWEDHYSSENWTAQDDVDLQTSLYVKSVGYRLKETRTKIVLIQNCASNGMVSCSMTIIKKNVKSRTVIREGK